MIDRFGFILTILFFLSQGLSAEISLPRIFGDHMVLQRDKPIVFWGWADAGEEISIQFANSETSAIADKNGKWKVVLEAKSAGGPHTLTIQGKNRIQYKNVLIGDLWLCSGQSNMQWTNQQIDYEEADTALIKDQQIRLFTVQIGTDYIPKKDFDGGEWKTLNQESITSFSAVAYNFGKYLQPEIGVPVGLINSSLGASYIEAWMSNEALMGFEQFKPEISTIIKENKSTDQLTAEFEKRKEKWAKKYYWKGPGLDEKWYEAGIDESDWKDIALPMFWELENEELKNHDGAVWFRTKFDLPKDYSNEEYLLQLNQIDDYDATWVNGTLIGETFGRHNFRNYTFKTSLLKPKDNQIVVRVFDIDGFGGFSTAKFWGNSILWGNWKYKKGQAVDVDKMYKPFTTNISPFSSPGVLYNANIAPISNLKIKGIIWYQGESNAERAEEYRELFPAMINDWRTKFNDSQLPFLYVQLANFMKEQNVPSDESWPELREAQDQAMKLNLVGSAIAIDIGEADDIHPKNKMEVGNRLAKSALKIAYEKEDIGVSPRYLRHEIKEDKVYISFDTKTKTVDKYGFIRGFAIAAEDRKFEWAKARFEGDQVVVYSEKVKDPVAIRYAWSANPGALDLYSEEGLPLAPFRTDDWEGITTNIKFDHKAARF